MSWRATNIAWVSYADSAGERSEYNWEIKSVNGTLLVVQWLRLCLPMQGMQVQSLEGSQDPTCLVVKNKTKHKTEAILYQIQ